MIDYVGMLTEFHEKYQHHINSMPTSVVNKDIKKLRLKLIEEEFAEVEEALEEKHLVKLADGLADLLYVVFGTAVSYGLGPIMDEIFAEVHRSNMTKSMEKDTKSIKGKTLKGDDWEPPQIREIISKHLDKFKEPRTAAGSLD